MGHTEAGVCTPFRRATSFSLVAISFSDSAISPSSRFFSFCANAM